MQVSDTWKSEGTAIAECKHLQAAPMLLRALMSWVKIRTMVIITQMLPQNFPLILAIIYLFMATLGRFGAIPTLVL